MFCRRSVPGLKVNCRVLPSMTHFGTFLETFFKNAEEAGLHTVRKSQELPESFVDPPVKRWVAPDDLFKPALRMGSACIDDDQNLEGFDGAVVSPELQIPPQASLSLYT